MDRATLKHGLFTQVSSSGEIPLLDDWVKSIKRFGLSNPGKDIFLPPVKVVHKKRSSQQNKAVMGLWMSIIMEAEYGEPYTQSEMLQVYNAIKVEMGWTVEKVNLKTGEIAFFPKSTHDLDKPDYSAWMESFQKHVAAEHGINLPDPDKALAVI